MSIKNESETGRMIRQAMNDINENANSVYWIGPAETIFERLWQVYVKHEGNDKALINQFFEYE